jgi:methylenetetrahydrofolate dehydrogenase (NADP+)/methenyltetrahydrofolate cyclohydrolase
MKILNGSDLAEYIQERQGQQVRSLVQSAKIQPKLAIIVTVENPVIDVYMRLKQRYGDDIGILVTVHRIEQSMAPAFIDELNNDATVQGIIIQLPLADPSQTDALVNLVVPKKDVDALGVNATYDPATPLAILWLLAGYNIDLKTKQVLLIGRGKLVGAPLERMLRNSGIAVTVADRKTVDLMTLTLAADVIVSATGQPGILTSEMVKIGTVVVDAGVASENGKTVGDVALDLHNRDDLTITPVKGGVGPLTVCALFDNVIRASRITAST